MIRPFLLLLLSGLAAFAQSPESPDRSQVAILGYHDFSSSQKETEMRINTGKFRDQMQALKDLNLPVISMADFIAWKKGEKSLPPRSVLITIDDGWKSVYTDAYPVFKEFGFPFTVFLYKTYVDGGGRALTTEMIEEMQKNGATIGCHSYTHPLPSAITRHQGKGPEHFKSYLTTEMLTSKTFLEKRFDQSISTYAYPGGFYTEEMFSIGAEFGYEMMFTVVPGKTRIDSPNHILNRYIILGTHDPRFEQATTFVGGDSGSTLPGAVVKSLEFAVSPAPGSLVETRLPLIQAKLSDLGEFDPESLKLVVSGFGEVPHDYDEETQTLSWQVRRPLRLPSSDISLRYRMKNSRKTQTARWTFLVDLEAAYLPR